MDIRFEFDIAGCQIRLKIYMRNPPPAINHHTQTKEL